MSEKRDKIKKQSMMLEQLEKIESFLETLSTKAKNNGIALKVKYTDNGQGIGMGNGYEKELFSFTKELRGGIVQALQVEQARLKEIIGE